MIFAALLLMAAAPPAAATPPAGSKRTALFLKCAAEGAILGQAHQLDMVFFDPKPTWAKGFNFFDPDKILPLGVVPDVTNKWPQVLEIELDSKVGGNSALIQLAPDADAPGKARLNIAIIDSANKPQPSFHGICNLTEGAAAEAEFKGLMKR